jgi:2,4-dienoyl-CoA reductase-like NADH-dependent reductase (Old Yellow Enzyme family)
MPKVFDPIRILSMELKNRLVVAPMFTNLASEHGYVTPLLTEGYRRQA